MDTEAPQAETPKRKRAPRQKKETSSASASESKATKKASKSPVSDASIPSPVPAPAISAQQSAELDRLIHELNELAEELKRTAQYTPPPFSPQAMAALLKENVGKFSPNLQVPILSELKQNLEGTKPEDLLNPDTWKGMWYILNYTAQAQSDQLKTKLGERLAEIPGASVLFDLKSSFEGAKPSDFLDINTWKGVAFILDHTLRTQAKEIKKKLLGGEEE